MTNKPKTQYYCQQCGESDVSRDASAIWNPESNAWELQCVFDEASCSYCGETDLVEGRLI